LPSEPTLSVALGEAAHVCHLDQVVKVAHEGDRRNVNDAPALEPLTTGACW